MSQENVEIVRRGYDAYNRGDVDAVAASFASDSEYIPTGALPGGRGSYQGPEGYKRFISWFRDEFEDAHVDVNELIDAGERVLASVTLRGRGRQSGAATSWDVWQLFTIRNGSVVRAEAFTDRAQALEAAGLRE